MRDGKIHEENGIITKLHRQSIISESSSVELGCTTILKREEKMSKFMGYNC